MPKLIMDATYVYADMGKCYESRGANVDDLVCRDLLREDGKRRPIDVKLVEDFACEARIGLVYSNHCYSYIDIEVIGELRGTIRRFHYSIPKPENFQEDKALQYLVKYFKQKGKK